MDHRKTGGIPRGLAIMLLPPMLVVVAMLALRAEPSSGRTTVPVDVSNGGLVDRGGSDAQAAPEGDRPSGPVAPLGPSPPLPDGAGGSDETAGISFGPPAEPDEVVLAAMAQEGPRGDIDELDGTSGAPVAPGPGQIDRAVDSGPAPSAGALQRNFPGVTYTGWIPPDDQIAAGPSQLVIPLNGAVAYYDKAGNNLFQTTLTGFFGSLADPVSSVFDPRVIWDHNSNRFILVGVGANDSTQASYYFVAVSNSADPFDGWCMRRLDATLDGATPTTNWADYPDVGVDPAGALYVSSNQFAFSGGFQYAKVRIMDKSDFIGAGCSGGIGWWDVWDFADGDGGTSFTLRMAADHGGLSTAHYWINSNSTNGEFLTIWRVTNPLPFPPALDGRTLTVEPYSTPPDARQPGGVQALDNIGTRLLNAVSYNDWVWVVGTDACDWGLGDIRSCVRWYQLDLFGWPTPTIDHQASWGAPSLDYFYPGITANSTRDVVISFARSSESVFPEARHTARLAADPADELQGSAQLKAGEASYLRLDGNGRNRWGDYAGVSYGANDEFWILHQYADDPYPPGHWDTWVGCIGLDESQCAALCTDREGDTACDDPVNDPDDDGCTTAEEAALGDNFDPDAWYDVYDVPAPAKADAAGANGKRNKAVDITDVLAVLFYAFADDDGPPNGNGVDYDSVKGWDGDGDSVNDASPIHDIEEGVKYDRSPGLGPDPVTGIDPAGPPNGAVDISDALAALAQAFVVDCSGP